MRVLIILGALAFISGQIIRWQFGNVGIVMLDIFVALSILFALFNFQKINFKDLQLRSALLFVSVGVLFLLGSITYLSTQDFFVSILYPIRWLSYFLISIIIKNLSLRQKISIKNAMICSGIGILLLGFIQYFFYPNLRNLYYLGWDEHLYRMFSSFLDPNFAGCFFVLYFIFLVGQFFEEKDKKVKYLLVLLQLLTLLAIVLTFSRSAIIMFAVCILLFAILKKQKIVLLSLVVFLIGVALFSNTHIENLNPFRVASSEARIESAKVALSIIQKNPISGVGFNAYRYAQIHYRLKPTQNLYPAHSDAGTDNSFLFILATTGIVGFGIFLNFLFQLMRPFLVRMQSKQNIHAIVVIVSFVGLIIDSMFINSLFYTMIMFWMWCLLGIMENTSQ